MFALCLESSHARGMGHFYRMINLANALKVSGHNCKFFLNNDLPSQKILQSANFDFDVVDLKDLDSGWEEKLIDSNGISIWVNDRSNTDIKHSERIKKKNMPLVTFDDRGNGAELSDLHIAALAFNDRENLSGERVLQGVEYLILNPEIAGYKRLRNSPENILVTLGGSDTYGVTVEVVRKLNALGKKATIIIGPAYQHHAELNDVLTPDFKVKQNAPSLIEEFSQHDLAITGGGITPFEANASGLPCIVIASERFEIPVGKELERMGGAVFAGYYKDFNSSTMELELPIEKMSQAGMDSITLNGCDSVVKTLIEFLH